MNKLRSLVPAILVVAGATVEMPPALAQQADEAQRSCQYQEPSWHPDGRHLAFLSNRLGEFRLYLVSVEGGEVLPLTDDSFTAGPVRWSPDGRRTAFWADGSLYLAGPDLEDARLLSTSELGASALAWSPSGDRIAFEGRRDGNNDIYIIGVDGLDLVRLTEHAGNDYRPD